MAETRAKLASVDPVWARIVKEAEDAVAKEPLLGGMISAPLLSMIVLPAAYRLMQARNTTSGARGGA